MRKEYLEVGKIVSTHALKGEVRVQPWADSTRFLTRFKTFYFDKKGTKSVKVESCKPHGNVCIVKLECSNSPEEAQALRNRVLYIKRDDAKLDDDACFVSELYDCKVVDADDESRVYGKITDVISTGANDVWQITSDKDYLIPVIPDVVVSVDIDECLVKIRPLKGIFDETYNGDE